MFPEQNLNMLCGKPKRRQNILTDEYQTPTEMKIEHVSQFLKGAIAETEKSIARFKEEIKKDETNLGLYCMQYSDNQHLQLLKVLDFLMDEIQFKK